jgi:hypothetical protein
MNNFFIVVCYFISSRSRILGIASHFLKSLYFLPFELVLRSGFNKVEGFKNFLCEIRLILILVFNRVIVNDKLLV